MNAQGLNLQGRNIVVTGAAQGIGRALGNLVLELGGTVTAVDLNAEGVQAFAAEAGCRPRAGDGRQRDRRRLRTEPSWSRAWPVSAPCTAW